MKSPLLPRQMTFPAGAVAGSSDAIPPSNDSPAVEAGVQTAGEEQRASRAPARAVSSLRQGKRAPRVSPGPEAGPISDACLRLPSRPSTPCPVPLTGWRGATFPTGRSEALLVWNVGCASSVLNSVPRAAWREGSAGRRSWRLTSTPSVIQVHAFGCCCIVALSPQLARIGAPQPSRTAGLPGARGGGSHRGGGTVPLPLELGPCVTAGLGLGGAFHGEDGRGAAEACPGRASRLLGCGPAGVWSDER